MDWTKAKTILIIALLLTDFTLGGLYYIQYLNRDMTQGSEVEATLEVLKNHEIYVDTEIPDRSPRMPVLFVRFDKEDEGRVREVLSQQEDAQNGAMTEKGIKHICDKVLKQCGFNEETLVYDSCKFQDGGAEVRYKNIYNGVQVEESGIVCTVEKGRVTAVERMWLTPTGYGGTKQKIIQATDALIQFMSEWVKMQKEEGEENLPREIHIQKIDLVYWLDSSVGPSDGVSEDTAVPAWRFTYNDGETIFIDGYDQR